MDVDAVAFVVISFFVCGSSFISLVGDSFFTCCNTAALTRYGAALPALPFGLGPLFTARKGDWVFDAVTFAPIIVGDRAGCFPWSCFPGAPINVGDRAGGFPWSCFPGADACTDKVALLIARLAIGGGSVGILNTGGDTICCLTVGDFVAVAVAAAFVDGAGAAALGLAAGVVAVAAGGGTRCWKHK